MNGRLRFALRIHAVRPAHGRSFRSGGRPRPSRKARCAGRSTSRLPPAWFDPGEVSGQLTPFWILYALHDALVKPMPGNMLSPSLAESWTVSADQLVYEFKLREGLKFHNGDPFTAEDVKFSFYRAKGSKILRDRVQGGGGGRALARALCSARALAGLHDLLRHHPVGSGLDRAQGLRRAGGRRRLQEGTRRARTLQVRQLHAWHRAGDGGERRLLAKDALGEAARLQNRTGEHDAAGHAEARRGRHRLPPRRATGAGGQTRPQARSWPSPAASPSSTSTSSTNGTRNRRGTTGACGWPRTMPSTARR